MFALNFVLGGAIGSVATYIYKDEKAREWVSQAGKNMKENSQAFIASFRKKAEETSSTAPAEAVTEPLAENTETAKK